jgi:hypothetical protein
MAAKGLGKLTRYDSCRSRKKLLAALIVIRARLADATLAKKLAGYADYATKVRYRPIPGVW